jgi:hypothetical protein
LQSCMKPFHMHAAHVFQSLACMPVTCMHSCHLHAFLLLGFLPLSCNPTTLMTYPRPFHPCHLHSCQRTASRRTEHVCIISALRSYTKAPVFTVGTSEKRCTFRGGCKRKSTWAVGRRSDRAAEAGLCTQHSLPPSSNATVFDWEENPEQQHSKRSNMISHIVAYHKVESGFLSICVYFDIF